MMTAERRSAVRESLEASFAAEKIAACTLAALRMHAKDGAEDAQIVALWEQTRWVIQSNAERVIARRDKRRLTDDNRPV